MKRFAFVLLMFSNVAFAQTIDQSAKIKEMMWERKDEAFNQMETPEKWREESAVILAQLSHFEYTKPSTRGLVEFNEYKHTRVKLQDKSAVEKYSELIYRSDIVEDFAKEMVKVYVGCKIVKPSRREMEIDQSQAVKMEREYEGKKRSYKKLAIPNLEPGDILDYYICEHNTISTKGAIFLFETAMFTLNQELPAVNHQLRFVTDRKALVSLASLNGAPAPESTLDTVTNKKIFSLDIKDSERAEQTRWTFPYRELPTLKFRAALVLSPGTRFPEVFLGKSGTAKSAVTEKEVHDLITLTMNIGDTDYLALVDYGESALKKITDPAKKAAQIYYRYRNQEFNTSEIEAVKGGSFWNSIDEQTFTRTFSRALSKLNVPNEVCVAVPRNINGLSDLLIEDELEWFVRVRQANGEYMYFSPFDMNTLPGILNPLLEGVDAYYVDGRKYSGEGAMKKTTLTTSSSADNDISTEIILNLADLNRPNVSVTRRLNHHSKQPEQYQMLDMIDLRAEEALKFKITETEDIEMSKREYEVLRNTYTAKLQAVKMERLAKSIESNFGVKPDEVTNFKILQSGRYLDHPSMEYSFDFSVAALVNKSGNNYTIDIGKLIEQQTKVEPDEVTRSQNIHYEYPRGYHHTITFHVPNGYSVQGLERLNQSIENGNGGFTCTANVAGGEVVIKTYKHYDTNFAKVSEWKSIIEFLNAAYNFNGLKLLLKKN